MSESSKRPSPNGLVMISVSILVLAGAIVYAARPRLAFVGDAGLYWDDGVVAVGYDVKYRNTERNVKELAKKQRWIRVGSVAR